MSSVSSSELRYRLVLMRDDGAGFERVSVHDEGPYTGSQAERIAAAVNGALPENQKVEPEVIEIG